MSGKLRTKIVVVIEVEDSPAGMRQAQEIREQYQNATICVPTRDTKHTRAS